MSDKRFSLFTKDLEHCIECGKSKINKHEIFYGRNRNNSIKYGLIIPLCQENHHNQFQSKGIHFDKKLCDKWHVLGQQKFMDYYDKSSEEFREIFGRNYL